MARLAKLKSVKWPCIWSLKGRKWCHPRSSKIDSWVCLTVDDYFPHWNCHLQLPAPSHIGWSCCTCYNCLGIPWQIWKNVQVEKWPGKRKPGRQIWVKRAKTLHKCSQFQLSPACRIHQRRMAHLRKWSGAHICTGAWRMVRMARLVPDLLETLFSWAVIKFPAFADKAHMLSSWDKYIFFWHSEHTSRLMHLPQIDRVSGSPWSAVVPSIKSNRKMKACFSIGNVLDQFSSES